MSSFNNPRAARKLKADLRQVCAMMNARLTFCNLDAAHTTADMLSADLFFMIEDARKAGAKTGVVLCPTCREKVLEFEILERQKTA